MTDTVPRPAALSHHDLNQPASTAQSPLPKDWWSIQYLRAIAALMVVFHHAREQFSWVKDAYPTEIGGAGVDVFFVVSGFIMVFITFAKPTTPNDFLMRRIIRIVPLYWIFTLLLVALVLLAPSLFRSVRFEPGHVIQSLLFIPHYGPDGRLNPILSLGWTLNYEMFFYLVFASLFFLRQSIRIAVIAAIFAGLVVAGMVYPGKSGFWHFLTNSVLLEFVFGMALADLVTRGIRISRGPSLLLFLAGLVNFVLVGWLMPENLLIRAVEFGAPAILMAAGLVFLERAGGLGQVKGLRIIGDASYSLYLSHIFTLGALRWIWSRLDLPESALLFTLAGLVACTAAGVIIHLLVERPILRACLSGLRVRRVALRANASGS